MSNWRTITVEASVPANALYIDYGLTLNGEGKVWVDPAGVKYEIIEDVSRQAPMP